MPKRSSTKRGRKSDGNESAFNAVQRIIDRTELSGTRNPAAVALGRLGGLKGGKARAAKLSGAQRKAIAQKAAKARWSVE